MHKPVPSRLSLDLFPPITDPGVHLYLESARENPFRPRATGIDFLNAWWLSELSLLAYSQPVFVETELRRAGLEPADPPLSGPGTQAFAALGDGFAAIAFRGTQALVPGRDPLSVLDDVIEDCLADIRIPLVPARRPARGRVHRGFRAALDEIREPLTELVGRLRKDDPGRALWLTGHSLGGALAILASALLPDVQGAYVFGAPHVGDAAFRDALPVRPVRFVHGSDLITRVPVFGLNLPPRLGWEGLLPDVEVLGTYRPAGDVIAFDRAGRIVSKHGADRAVESLKARVLHKKIGIEDWARLQPIDDVIDHAPIFYAVHLWNVYDESLGRMAA